MMTTPKRKRIKCIEGGHGPCPTCPVSHECEYGQKKLHHDPEILRHRITTWLAYEAGSK